MDVRGRPQRKLNTTKELILLNCGVGEDSWESHGLQEDQTSQYYRKSVLNIHWKDSCWSWSSSTLATWSKEPTQLEKLWSWERLKVGGEGDDRGWYGWMASLTQWTWVWANSERWWRTGRPGVLQSMVPRRVGHDWETEKLCLKEIQLMCGKQKGLHVELTVFLRTMQDCFQSHALLRPKFWDICHETKNLIWKHSWNLQGIEMLIIIWISV